MVLSLPDFIVPLTSTDPSFAALNNSLAMYGLLPPPGGGNFLEAQPVKFTTERSVYRVYGGGEGKAGQCGRWWNLDPPQSDTSSYFLEFAVCPIWNDATNLVRCSVPVGYTALVGIGQSATCPNNTTIVPDQNILQLNGDICSIADMEGEGLTCEWCAAEQFSLETSACVAAESNDNTDESAAFDQFSSSTTGAAIVAGLLLPAALMLF
jgi:hypothetical protein